MDESLTCTECERPISGDVVWVLLQSGRVPDLHKSKHAGRGTVVPAGTDGAICFHRACWERRQAG